MPSSDARDGSEFRKCPDCGGMIPAWQHRHRARTCPGYSELWAGDVRMKLFAAGRAYVELCKVRAAKVSLITITGPGVQDAGLVWDESICADRGPHRHSGPEGCRVAAAPADAFNRHAPGWWTRLHNEAAQEAERLTGRRPMHLARVWELQRRGVLHVHVLEGHSTPAEKAAADAYQAALAEKAAKHGFGFVDRKRQVAEASQAMAYLSSYFVAGKKGKASLRESVTSGAMPVSIVYVRPELSQRSGVTMRSLRLKRYLWRLGSGWMWLHLERGFGIEDVVRAHGAGITFAQLVEGQLAADT